MVTKFAGKKYRYTQKEQLDVQRALDVLRKYKFTPKMVEGQQIILNRSELIQ